MIPAVLGVDALQGWTLELYSRMLSTFYVEERIKIFVRQGKCSFQRPVADMKPCKLAWRFSSSLDMTGFLRITRPKHSPSGSGCRSKTLFLGMLSRDGDPNSNGRNMLEQFSSRELRLVSQTACTGTQYLPAVGMARAVIRLDPHPSSDDQKKYRHPEELDAVVVEDPIRRAEEDLLKEGV